VKGWQGEIEANDDAWIVGKRDRRKNPVNSIMSKARILHEHFFGNKGSLRHLRNVSVTGLVVMTEGLHDFHNYCSCDPQVITGLDRRLRHAVSSTDLLFRRGSSRALADEEIEEVYEEIYGKHQSRNEDFIAHYRLVKKLQHAGDLAFDEYEAQNVNVETQRVRVKRYQFHKFSGELVDMVETIRHFKRSVEVVSALGQNAYILNTNTFFADDKSPYIYYEVTELPTGPRLDTIMENTRQALKLEEQLQYLLSICEALRLMYNYHNHDGYNEPIYHRNISPKTVFSMQNGTVKLADFDFAKFGTHTINPLYSKNPLKRNQTLIEKPYTAPELLQDASRASAASDIYALGVLWYFLACLPEQDPPFQPGEIAPQIDKLSLPAEAQTLLKRMVASEPGGRPQDIEEIITLLRQLQ
jgi:serine/threonine protein kinase